MAIGSSVLEAMLKAGCTAEQIVAVVKADEMANSERLAEKREKSRIRQRNHRSRNTVSRVTECDTTEFLSPSGSSPRPLSPNPQSSIPPSPPKGGSSPAVTAEFDRDFWPLYPNKVGKPDGFKAFVRARQRADLETILVGLRAYVAKTDDRPWCNPSTWLNQDRWNDRPAVVARGQPPPGSGNPMVDRLDELMAGMERRNADDGRTIEGSYFDGTDHRPAQAVLGLAAPPGRR